MAYAAVGRAIGSIKQAAAAVSNPTFRGRAIAGQLEILQTEMEFIQDFFKDINLFELEFESVDAFACEVENKTELFALAMSSKLVMKDCFSRRKMSGLIRGGSAVSEFAHQLPNLLQKAREFTEMLKRDQLKLCIEEGLRDEESETWQRRKDFLYRDVEESNIVGFEQHIEKLMDKVMLVNDDSGCVSTISIVGMAGLGKTTLAKIVYKSVEHHFDCSAMIHISQTPNNLELLLSLAKQVGFKEEQVQEDDLATNVRAYLADKRYLILLDDVWDAKSWESLAIAIPNNCRSGSRIIITSRNKEVGLQTGWVSSLIYELQPLDGTDCWNLFSKRVIETLSITDEYAESIGKRIVGKCGGVPLAVVSVANFFWGRGATIEDEWRNKLHNMDNICGMCSESLVLSYKYLPVGLQSCFLYLGLFRKDYDLFASDIIKRWVAEGLIGGGGGRLEPEDVGEDYLNHLASNSLIRVSSRRFDEKIRIFRIPKVIHRFCCWMAKKTISFNPQTTVRRATIFQWEGIARTPKVCDLDKNFQFVYFDETEKPEFFERFEFLRVLIVGSALLPSVLSKGLANLNLLRHLGSSYELWPPVQVKLPSNIGDIKWLITLDLRDVEYETLPDGIWKMEHLRHILLRKLSLCTLSRIDKRRGMSRIKVNLPNLQTLYVVPGQLLLPEMLQTSTKLRKLGIDCPTDSVIELLSSSEPIFKKLEILWLRCHHPVNGTATIAGAAMDLSSHLYLRRLHLNTKTVPKHDELPPNLMKLVLVLHDAKEDPMKVLSRLPKLKILKLYVEKCVVDNIVCSGGPLAFPELEGLELQLPFYVRKFTVEEDAMPKLKKISGISSRMLLEVPERIRAVCLTRIH